MAVSWGNENIFVSFNSLARTINIIVDATKSREKTIYKITDRFEDQLGSTLCEKNITLNDMVEFEMKFQTVSVIRSPE